MSDFKELIKSFSKTREYVRDFYVYGFKTREEFKEKSPRTYDNERRRLESWLGDYVQRDQVENGANISLAIDSNLLDTNPLFQVWKTKSFTDNDIMLHFMILDLLADSEPLTADEITELLLTQYETLFDLQTVRRKCNTYADLGLLVKKKLGRTVVYELTHQVQDWILANPELLWALSFYQLSENFGILGNELLDQFDCHNELFRVKHSFFVHTLEDEILLEILTAMKEKKEIELETKSSKKGTVTVSQCVPLQIFTSTRSGRRFLCAYLKRSRRFTTYRLDTIKKICSLTIQENYDELRQKLDANREQLWGVSFQGREKSHLDRLTMVLQVYEPSEHYIVTRLLREGRGGTITQISIDGLSQTEPATDTLSTALPHGETFYRYETEVFDCNEMMPWIRTFIGRIQSLQCTDKAIERRFYQDLKKMYDLYEIGPDSRTQTTAGTEVSLAQIK